MKCESELQQSKCTKIHKCQNAFFLFWLIFNTFLSYKSYTKRLHLFKYIIFQSFYSQNYAQNTTNIPTLIPSFISTYFTAVVEETDSWSPTLSNISAENQPFKETRRPGDSTVAKAQPAMWPTPVCSSPPRSPKATPADTYLGLVYFYSLANMGNAILL